MNLDKLNSGSTIEERNLADDYVLFCRKHSVITSPDTMKNLVKKLADQFDIEQVHLDKIIQRQLQLDDNYKNSLARNQFDYRDPYNYDFPGGEGLRFVHKYLESQKPQKNLSYAEVDSEKDELKINSDLYQSLIHKIASTFDIPGNDLKMSMFEELNKDKEPEQEIEPSDPKFNQLKYSWEFIPTDIAKMANDVAKTFNLDRNQIIDIFAESTRKDNFKNLVTQSVKNLPKLGEKIFTPDYLIKKKRSQNHFVNKALKSSGLSTVQMSDDKEL